MISGGSEVGVFVGVAVSVGVGVGEAVGVMVGVEVMVGDGVRVAVGVGVEAAVPVGAAVGGSFVSVGTSVGASEAGATELQPATKKASGRPRRIEIDRFSIGLKNKAQINAFTNLAQPLLKSALLTPPL
ncbi:MAG: hypothetical protein J4N76_10705 [Chloroflexi bacterium]|nr:hypothetical protein [Chloroflexota bacterium]MCI0827837.1 hypothetical protein [Chloroflexota bacterium]MCI0877014.1 hypothetical protein [Chloroflexota bacterium]